MKVYMGKKVIEREGKIRVRKLLRELGADELTYLIIDRKRQVLLTPDEMLDDDSEIELRKVTSGG